MSAKYSVKTWLWVAFLLVVGVFARWLPHPPNFTPFLAISLFAGLLLPAPLAMIVPIASLFLGDMVLGFHDLAWVVYLSLLPVVWMGRQLPEVSRKPGTWLGWGLAGLLAALFFFITTNFAVWMTSDMYPHNNEGLTTCFLLAIPFFHNSLVSTWAFLAGFEVVRRLQPRLLPAVA